MQYWTNKNNILGVTALRVDDVEGEGTYELSIKIIEEYMNQKIKPEDIRSHWLGNPKKCRNAKCLL